MKTSSKLKASFIDLETYLKTNLLFQSNFRHFNQPMADPHAQNTSITLDVFQSSNVKPKDALTP